VDLVWEGSDSRVATVVVFGTTTSLRRCWIWQRRPARPRRVEPARYRRGVRHRRRTSWLASTMAVIIGYLPSRPTEGLPAAAAPSVDLLNHRIATYNGY